MAALTLPTSLEMGVNAIVCLRNPLAHAASFKRRRWSGEVQAVYPNYRAAYGPVDEVERLLTRNHSLTSVETAAILWHLIYSLLERLLHEELGYSGRLMIMSSTALESRIERRAQLAGEDDTAPKKVHQWERSVRATNSYWMSALHPEEVCFVNELNGEIFARLEQSSHWNAKNAIWL
jgi:hypothetical protein